MVLQPLAFDSQRAFTLFEMLIAMTIAAIILAVALPAYQDSVRRGRRADAVAALSAAQLSQERFRANVSSYASVLSDLQGVSANSPDGHYAIAVTAAGTSNFTLSATAKGDSPQFNDVKCRQLILQVRGGNVAYLSSNAGSVVDTNNSNRCWAR